MSNFFHQLKLGLVTSSARLSIQTPWGQVDPVLMPEGIGPASFHLQAIVSLIFNDFADWLICIFNNILSSTGVRLWWCIPKVRKSVRPLYWQCLLEILRYSSHIPENWCSPSLAKPYSSRPLLPTTRSNCTVTRHWSEPIGIPIVRHDPEYLWRSNLRTV